VKKRGKPFEKGQPRPEGAGRKKGVQNKYTRDVKEALYEAGERYGSDGKGKDGLIGCMMRVIAHKPEAWMTAISKTMVNRHSISNNDNSIEYETLEEIEKEMREAGIIMIEESK
jgi:hypothetical protein